MDTYDDLAGYVNLSGVRSTGLTASIALGKYVVQTMLERGLDAQFKANFIEKRKGIRLLRDMTNEERERAIASNPLYGRVICRCETVTEGEIVDAIHSYIPARSVDAIKRRLRAGMGRCQGGFCGPKVLEILARELKCSPKEINKNIDVSDMVTGTTR